MNRILPALKAIPQDTQPYVRSILVILCRFAGQLAVASLPCHWQEEHHLGHFAQVFKLPQGRTGAASQTDHLQEGAPHLLDLRH